MGMAVDAIPIFLIGWDEVEIFSFEKGVVYILSARVRLNAISRVRKKPLRVRLVCGQFLSTNPIYSLHAVCIFCRFG
jgi:hypothetical protein